MQNWQLRPANDLDLPLGRQLRSVRRESGLFTAAAQLLWSASAAIYLRLFHRLSVEGRQHLPATGSYVLAANHASHLDALILAAALPWRLQTRVFPIAAGDKFFSTPLTGAISALLINALPIWRNRACLHGVASLRQRLMQEHCVFIVFPEGTRSRTGQMAPFRAGVGMLIAATVPPVVPCRLIGTYKALPHNRRWPKPIKLRLKIGKPISFAHVANDRQGWESITKILEEAVNALNP